MEISGYIVAALLFFALSQVKTWFQSKKFFDASRMINKNAFTRDLMVELRVMLDADRIKLFQFHNGDYFVSGESAMKCTMTHVANKTGIAYPDNANIYYSALPTSYLTRTLCTLNDNHYMLIKTADMEDDHYLKSIFISHNVKVAVMVPVTDVKNKWIGFLMCVWLHDDLNEINKDDVKLYSSKIGNALSTK